MIVPAVPLLVPAQPAEVPHLPGTTIAGSLADTVNSCLNGTRTLKPAALRAAFVIPTFTLTPYRNWNSSFYAFYIKYKEHHGRIDTDLRLLTTKVLARWSVSDLLSEEPFYRFLSSPAAARCGLVLGQNLLITNDTAVDGGSLFTNKVRNYDVLILGHQEYATRAEYNQFRQFVATGGRLVEMSGNTFWGEVSYSKDRATETFVSGHGFRFDGKHVWHSSDSPFDSESASWFGSTFARGVYGLRGAVVEPGSRYGRVLLGVVHSDLVFTGYAYPHDEVNYLRNFTDTEIIATFYHLTFVEAGVRHYIFPTYPVAAYIHGYRQGEVVCLCIFGESIISKDPGAQFFLLYATLVGSGRLS